MKLPKDKVKKIRAIKETLSLDIEVDENATLEDFVADEDVRSPDEYAYCHGFHPHIEKILDTLDREAAMIVKMRKLENALKE